MPKEKVNHGIRVAYQTWTPEKNYDGEFYRKQITWNQFQHSLAKLRRTPRIGRLEGSAIAEAFDEERLTCHALANGAASYRNSVRD